MSLSSFSSSSYNLSLPLFFFEHILLSPIRSLLSLRSFSYFSSFLSYCPKCWWYLLYLNFYLLDLDFSLSQSLIRRLPSYIERRLLLVFLLQKLHSKMSQEKDSRAYSSRDDENWMYLKPVSLYDMLLRHFPCKVMNCFPFSESILLTNFKMFSIISCVDCSLGFALSWSLVFLMAKMCCFASNVLLICVLCSHGFFGETWTTNINKMAKQGMRLLVVFNTSFMFHGMHVNFCVFFFG